MTDDQNPSIGAAYEQLWDRLRAQGLEAWLRAKSASPDREELIYLCKFAYFTGLITKGELARWLGLSPGERRRLVRSWYDDHRQKGCGTC
jgi:hypothetical protein